MRSILPLGAFDVALERCSEPHRELLEGLYRARVESTADGEPVHLRLALSTGDDGPGFGAGAALLSWETADRLWVSSDLIAGYLDRSSAPPRLCLWIDHHSSHAVFLDHYLRIVLNAVFRRLGRVRLHAGAVDLAGSTSLFVGDKGAGKTTICLALARAGGTILGEDQIMVRRTHNGEFRVAGGDVVMRLTTKTEAFFFPGSLPVPTVMLAGMEKKEIQAHDYVTCMPNCEHSPRRVFFPEVGECFDIRPLTGREALGRLAAPLTPIHRFVDDLDRRDFLAFLVGLTRQAECFSLSLTPRLEDLEKLSGFLT